MQKDPNEKKKTRKNERESNILRTAMIVGRRRLRLSHYRNHIYIKNVLEGPVAFT